VRCCPSAISVPVPWYSNVLHSRTRTAMSLLRFPNCDLILHCTRTGTLIALGQHRSSERGQNRSHDKINPLAHIIATSTPFYVSVRIFEISLLHHTISDSLYSHHRFIPRNLTIFRTGKLTYHPIFLNAALAEVCSTTSWTIHGAHCSLVSLLHSQIPH
jgi:hypothetical protein